MNDPYRKIIHALSEFVLVSLLTLLAPLILAIDIVVLHQGISETSLVEITQETLILFCMLSFANRAWQDKHSRGFLLLITGTFGCILIRELDWVFDALIFHGSWVWPAAIIVIGAITTAFTRCRATILDPMARFIGTRAYFFMFFGFLTLLFISRTFGSSVLWEHVLGPHYDRMVKSATQETLELLGYIYISYGACLFTRRQD